MTAASPTALQEEPDNGFVYVAFLSTVMKSRVSGMAVVVPYLVVLSKLCVFPAVLSEFFRLKVVPSKLRGATMVISEL